MMPVPFSDDLRRRVIWFVHVLKHSVPEASLFWGRLWKNSWALYFQISCYWRCKVENNRPFIRGNEERLSIEKKKKQKTGDSFVFGVKNPQTNVHSWCVDHFHARGTQLICMEFCISNSVTTVPFGRASSVRPSPFAILSDNLFWNSCMFVSAKGKRQK